MIEGITILNQTELYEESILLVILLFILIVGGISTIILLAAGCFVHATIIGLISFISLMLMIFVPNKYTFNYLGNSYEVIIDDSVSINELADQFVIKEHRGDIWILEDKNNKERERINRWINNWKDENKWRITNTEMKY